MKVSLNYIPREWQRRCHLALQRFSVLAVHRRAGKTELAIMRLLDAALRFNLELGLFFYVAPFLKQAKAVVWSRMKQILEPLRVAGAVVVSEAELSVTFLHNGAKVRLYGGDNPDGMRGVRLDGAVLDEVAQMKPEVWNDILQPALSDRHGWALFIGTPDGVNLFSELFYKAQTTPEWFSARFTVYDTDALDEIEIARLRRDMSETAFAREFLCDFTASGDDQLISLTDCEVAAQRIITERDIMHAPRILGCDPARFGNDSSVIVPRQGLQTFLPIARNKLDNMSLAGLLVDKIEEFQPDAVFVDAGNGAGVIDRCRQLGYEIIEVNFGGSPAKPEFADKRAEMWWRAKEYLGAGGAIPNISRLKQDLATPKYSYDNAHRKRIESKDDIRARGLPSTDYGDAFALTFAHPVHKRNAQTVSSRAGERGRPLETPNIDYDPYVNVR